MSILEILPSPGLSTAVSKPDTNHSEPLSDSLGNSLSGVHPDILSRLVKEEEILKLDPNTVITYNPAKGFIRCFFMTDFSKIEEVVSYNGNVYDSSSISLSERWKMLVENREKLVIERYSKSYSGLSLEALCFHVSDQPKDLFHLLPILKLPDLISVFNSIGRPYYGSSFNITILFDLLKTHENPYSIFKEILKTLSNEKREKLFQTIIEQFETPFFQEPNFHVFIKLLFNSLEINKEHIQLALIAPHALEASDWERIYLFVQDLINIRSPATPLTEIDEENKSFLTMLIFGSIESKNPDMLKKFLYFFKNLDFIPTGHRIDDSHTTIDKSIYRIFLKNAILSGDLNCIRVLLETADIFSLKDIQDSFTSTLSAIPNFFINEAEKGKYLSKHLAIIDYLLSYGLDKDLITTDHDIPYSLPEFYFFSRSPVCIETSLYLIRKGARITPRIESIMKMELNEHPEYIDLLKSQGKITDEEIRALICSDKQTPGSKDDLIRRMIEGKDVLTVLQRRYAANPFIEDFESINKYRLLKKEAKRYCLTHPEDSIFKTLYLSFCSSYDTLITSHYVLSSLRDASRSLRKLLSERNLLSRELLLNSSSDFAKLKILFGFWHPLKSFSVHDATKVIVKTTESSRSAYWDNIRSNCLKYLEKINRDSFWNNRCLICVHGTKLNPDMIKERGLVPMGMMSRADGVIVPFSGEHVGSMEGINKKHISSSIIGRLWCHNKPLMFDVLTPLINSLFYAKQVHFFTTGDTIFDYDKAKESATWSFILENIIEKEPEMNWQKYCSNILRLRAWDPSLDFSDLLLKVRGELEKTSLSSNQKFYLQKIEEYLTVKIKYPLDAKDRKLIQMNIPIVFGTTSSIPVPIETFITTGKVFEEVLMPGSQMFGSNIQVAFVEEESLAEVASHISPFGVKVYPFETSYAIETEKMMREEHKISTSSQLRISSSLQSDILPAYGRLFPENPTYVKDGKLNSVATPFFGRDYGSYTRYKKAVEETLVPARHIHGKMHAVRTAIAAQMWSHFYEASMGSKMEMESKDSQFLLAVTAAAHDSQRQDEGTDRWDSESGEHLKNYLASYGFSEDICLLYSKAITEKDPHKKDITGHPIFDSNVQRYVHDADAIELLRVINESEFLPDRLAFTQEWKKYKTIHARDPGFLEKSEAVDAEFKTLISEWNRFVKLTEEDTLKLHLEYTADLLYYNEVLKVLKTNAAHFPLLTKYLKCEIDELIPTV